MKFKISKKVLAFITGLIAVAAIAVAVPVLAAPTLNAAVGIVPSVNEAYAGDTVTYKVTVTAKANLANVTVAVNGHKWTTDELKNNKTITDTFDVTYAEAGTYTTTVTVTADGMTVQNATATVTVKKRGTPDVNDKMLVFNAVDGKFYYYRVTSDPRDSVYTEYTEQADKWSWDGKTNTLTLNGFAWETSAPIALQIYTGNQNIGDITIFLKDTNTFRSTYSGPSGDSIGIDGISSMGTLIFDGNGILNAYGNSMGISSPSTIIKGGTINTYGGAYGMKIAEMQIYSGILNAFGNNQQNSIGIVISNNMPNTLIVHGGTLTASGNSYAIYNPFNNSSVSVTAPSYKYWVGLQPLVPRGNEYTYPGDPAFVNSDTYKYVKIQATDKPDPSGYTVTYNPNGGDGAPVIQTAGGVYYVTTNELFTRNGYTFRGWTTDSASTTAEYLPGQYIGTVTADLTLYAIWHNLPDATLYKQVQYDANGGDGAPPAQTIWWAGTWLILSDTTPVRDGYRFLGWSADSTAKDAEYLPGPGNYMLRSGPYTLYAVWSNNPVIQITSKLTYDANGGTGAPAAQELNLAGVFAKLSYTIPTRDGYTFLGWSTNSIDKSSRYQPGQQIYCTGGETLYAVWSSTVPKFATLTYDANGGIGAPAPQVVNAPANQIQLSDIIPTRDGYTFLGWSVDSTAASANIKKDDYIQIGSDRTIYAIWAKATTDTYTITYDANGGKGAPDAQTAPTNAYATLSDIMPAYDNYQFAGWAVDSEATTAQYKPGDQIYITTNITLYAVWIAGPVVPGDIITGVTISPTTIDLKRGDTLQFTATVLGTNNPAQTVIWSFMGDNVVGTMITSDGLLMVGANETATTLTVTAASTVDGTKFGTAKVTIVNALGTTIPPTTTAVPATTSAPATTAPPTIEPTTSAPVTTAAPTTTTPATVLPTTYNPDKSPPTLVKYTVSCTKDALQPDTNKTDWLLAPVTVTANYSDGTSAVVCSETVSIPYNNDIIIRVGGQYWVYIKTLGNVIVMCDV